MRLFLVPLAAIFMILLPSHVSATVYQCEKDGVAVFSQFPCGEDAKEVTIKTPNIAQTQGDEAAKKASESIDSYIGTQKIDRTIAQHQQAIQQLQQQFSQNKQQINYMTQDSANRMGASSIADAIKMRTEQLESYIEPQIKNHEQAIKALTEQKESLRTKTNL